MLFALRIGIIATLVVVAALANSQFRTHSTERQRVWPLDDHGLSVSGLNTERRSEFATSFGGGVALAVGGLGLFARLRRR